MASKTPKMPRGRGKGRRFDASTGFLARSRGIPGGLPGTRQGGANCPLGAKVEGGKEGL